MRRTKIVATLGPASDTTQRLTQLVAAGVDVFRLNFSHGTHDDHAARILRIRAASEAAGRPIAILQDLQGPKIRTGALKGGMPVMLQTGAPFTIVMEEREGDARTVSTTYTALADDAQVGERILVSDGIIELRVTAVRPGEVQTQVVHGGSLRERQGISLPDSGLSTPAVTDKDRVDLEFGLSQGVDYVAMSFVRRAADVEQLKALIAQAGKHTPIVAKIEKPQALLEIDAILEATDTIMVARGDLGVEMPLEHVPLVQKDLITAAGHHNVSVITATQMLESMIQNARPTRAETSDVANAIFDGTDAIMLSGETATGQYPVEAVEVMVRIATVTEASDRYQKQREAAHQLRRAELHPNSSVAISHAARAIAETLPIKAIVAFTQSGYTARLVSTDRPGVPIFALTPSPEVARRVALYWGVTPLICPFFEVLSDVDGWVNHNLPALGLAAVGDQVVITGGHPMAAHGATNFLKVLSLE